MTERRGGGGNLSTILHFHFYYFQTHQRFQPLMETWNHGLLTFEFDISPMEIRTFIAKFEILL